MNIQKLMKLSNQSESKNKEADLYLDYVADKLKTSDIHTTSK